MDRQDAKPNRPSLLANDAPRGSTAPSASRILADMESRAPGAAVARKPRVRRRSRFALWAMLGIAGVVLAGAAWWWLEVDAEHSAPPLTVSQPMSSPVLDEPLPLPTDAPSGPDRARVLSALEDDALAGSAANSESRAPAPRNAAPAKIISDEADNPFAVINKPDSAANPAAPAAVGKTDAAGDPFAVVAQDSPAAMPNSASDDNPFAAAAKPAPAAAAMPAKLTAPTTAKPVAAAPRSEPKTPVVAKPASTATAVTNAAPAPTPAPKAGNDLLTHLMHDIETANQVESTPSPRSNATRSNEKTPAAKPVQRKTEGTDAEVLDDLVKQVNGGREAVEKPIEAASGARELLKKR